MKTILINIVAVLVGLVFGSAMNMGLITLGHHVIALPAAADVSSMESLKESMHLFQPQHFLFPFLAHAVGTLVGAILAALIAGSRSQILAYLAGVIFISGGVLAFVLVPPIKWYHVVVFDAVLVSIAAIPKINIAYVVGAAFLCGGAINVYLLPAPMWFNAVDLIFAYIPMAWLGGKIAQNLRPSV